MSKLSDARHKPNPKAVSSYPPHVSSVPAGQFYTKYGLHVSRYAKSGKRRLARASSSLRMKSYDELLRIVQAYGGIKKKREFEKRKQSLAWICNWIEMAETLALGSCPCTKLKLEDWEASEFNDPNGITEYCIHEGDHTGLNKERKVQSHGPTREQSASKRPRKSNQTGVPPTDAAASNRTSAPAQRASTQKDSVASKTLLQQATIRNHPVLAKDSAMQDCIQTTITQPPPRILQHSEKETASKGTSQLKVTEKHYDSAHPMSHFDNVAEKLPGRQSLRTQRDIQPFIKQGMHGRHSDFDANPDRATGVGHNYDLEDFENYEDHMKFRSEFYHRYPTFPNLDKDVVIDPGFLEMFSKEQAWYRDFRKKYPGIRSDQWVCGCQKTLDETENESEEE